MRSLASTLVLSTLVSFVVSVPVDNSAGTVVDAKGGKGTTIHQSVERTRKTGAEALAAAYRKYKKPVPKAVANAEANDQDGQFRTSQALAAGDGSTPANPELYDVEYLCPVAIGSNGKVLNLNFDTGSADLWVYSTSQPTAQTTGHDIYDPTKSTTSKRLNGATFNIQYGDGSGASGIVYTDTVNLGGVTVTSQAVEAASSVSPEFQSDTNNDGLMGLAFGSINAVQPTPQKTFFENAIAQAKLTRNVFTADLKKGKPGSYGFGGVNTTQYTGTITYTPVNKAQGFWGFTSSGYGVGSTFTAGNIAGIADTGTTLLLLPSAAVTAYWSKVSGATFDNNQGAYTFPCSATLPTFTVGVGAARYTLPGPYLNYGPISSTTCYGGLQSSDGFGMNIFGDIFLKGVFVVFDSVGPQIGFATKNL